MAKVLAGRLVLSFAAIFTAVTPYLPDWNETHIFNPLRTPHAKFHNAQTMAFAALLGLLALGYTWWRRVDGDDRERIVQRASLRAFTGLRRASRTSIRASPPRPRIRDECRSPSLPWHDATRDD